VPAPSPAHIRETVARVLDDPLYAWWRTPSESGGWTQAVVRALRGFFARIAILQAEQPVLYWFISSPSSHPVELTLVDPQKSDPLVELRIEPPVAAGVHRVRLADHGVRLAPAVSYNWYVAVMPDTGRRSKDILAGGTVERVSMPDGLATKVSGTSKADLPNLYAEAGLWYDAIAALNDLIDQSPGNQALREQRSALLRQVGLPADTTTE